MKESDYYKAVALTRLRTVEILLRECVPTGIRYVDGAMRDSWNEIGKAVSRLEAWVDTNVEADQ